jgi:Bacterial Ig domain/Cadherin domain
VTGDGDTDNASFQITGDTLKTNEEFDFETKDSYTIRVKTDDGNGGTFEKQLTISITNANDAPSDIALSASSVAENQPSGTTVGTFSSTDQDSADTHTYTLVSGAGSEDNGSFQISGSTLQTNEEFDFETKDTYSVRVKTDDGNGGTFEKQFTISITNANDAPTNLALSNSSVAENQPSGTTVGTLSTTDEDTADTHTYTLVSGTGDTDNAKFQISGSALQTNEVFDFETKNSYTVRVKTDDGNGGTFEKQLTISVTNANDAPTDIALSKSDIDENRPSGTPVGTFSTTDQDSADTHTYALVSGTGSTDNGQFQIVGGELRTNASFNFEVKNSYSIRVSTTDNGSPTKSFEEAFTISINDVNDAPVATADTYSGAIGNTKASVGVTVTGEPVVALTGNVLTNNDTDEDQPAQPLSAVAETVSSTGGGTATISANGSFTFLPGVGDKNQNDTFTYHLTDGTATASGTVTVGIANALVWYVDNAKATNGDGRSSSPLNTLTGINNAAGGTGDSDGSGDILFLYQGSGNYTGGLPLEANQQLLGQPNGLTVNNGVSNVTLVSPSGSRPTITNASNNGITLGTGNTIRSLNVGNASNFGISGGSFGTLDVADTGINSTGQALNLNSGTLSGSGFTGVSSSGGPSNVSLAAVGTGGSTFSLGSGTLSGATSDAFKVIGSGSFSYSGNISQATSGAALVSASGGHNGTLTFSSGTLSATNGTGLQFDNADGTYNFNGTTTLNGGDAGIDILNGSTGTYSFGSGTAITNPSGTGFNLSGATASNANVTYSGNISKNNSGPAINIDNHDANTVTFQTGTLSSTGTSSGIRVQNSNGGTINFNQPTKTLNTGTNAAIALSTNTGGTMNFGGGLDIDTTSGAGFSATGGGTVSVGTGANPNTIDSTTGTALNVANTTIGASGLTFQSISSNGGSNTGIILDTTGNNGGLTVTGTGTAGSGGTIANKTGADGSTTTGVGIYLNSTRNVSLSRMQLNGFQNFAIRGASVNGFALQDSVVSGLNGNSAGFDEGSILLANGLGTYTISGVNVSGGFEDNLSILHDGAAAVTTVYNVTGSTFRDLQAAGQNSQVKLISTTAVSSSSNVTFNFTGANVFENDANTTPGSGTVNWSDGILTTFEGPFPHTLNVQNATFHHLFQGMDIASGFSADVNYVFKNNVITFTEGVAAIAMGTGSTATSSAFITALIQGNTIGTSGVAQSGSRLGQGIVVDMRGNEVAQMTIHGNTIQRTEVNPIRFLGQVGDGDTALQITSNIIREIEDDAGAGQGVIYGIEVTTNTGGSYDVCLDARNNDSANINAHDIRVRQATANNTFQLEGFAGDGTVASQVEAFLATQNPANTTNVRTGGSVVMYTSGSCTTPVPVP